MRIWKCVVEDDEKEKTVEQFLKMHDFSKKEISRMKFKASGILVDGVQQRSNYPLEAGQEVEVCLQDENDISKYTKKVFSEKKSALERLKEYNVEIFYEDKDILILSKPSGLSCHPGRGHYYDNLGSLAVSYCGEKGENISIRQIGRLDKDTSGGVVFAKNQSAAARLWKQKENGSFQKIYYVLVHGKMEQIQGAISFQMEEVPDAKNRMRVCEHGMNAVTYYRVLAEYDTDSGWISKLECKLETGRTHQIRVHMAAMGHPVLGDSFYGIEDGVKRLCLHAGKLFLCQPYTGEKIQVEIPAPEFENDERKKAVYEKRISL